MIATLLYKVHYSFLYVSVLYVTKMGFRETHNVTNLLQSVYSNNPPFTLPPLAFVPPLLPQHSPPHHFLNHRSHHP